MKNTLQQIISNGMPKTLGIENVENYLNSRSGGFMSVISYTDPKLTSKGKKSGLNIVKLGYYKVINGNPKIAKENANSEKKPTYYVNKKYNVIVYTSSNEKALRVHLNKKFKSYSIYVNADTNEILSKEFLIENGYISKPSNYEPKDINWVVFKFDKIISLK